MSALETLSHYDTQMHPVGLEILFILQFLRNKSFNIIFCWVPSHVGISGNETADAIAKFASAVLPRALPYVDVKKFFVSHLFSLWQQKWDLLTNNKLHSVKPSIGLWPSLPIRQVDVKLSRLRIGHTRFTHKYLIFGERAPVCPTCHQNFTVHHILIECPSFNSHRVDHFHSSSVTLQDLLRQDAKTLRNSPTRPASPCARPGDLQLANKGSYDSSDWRSRFLRKRVGIALTRPKVTVSPHATLNSSKGVITCGELLNVPTEEILKEFQGQGKLKKKLKKDSPTKPNHSITKAEKVAKFYTTSHREITNPISTKNTISTHQSTLKPFSTTTPTSVDIELLPMAVLPPLEKRILQSRESVADAEMSSSSASEEDALEYNMSEDLEDSPAVISPPPPFKPEKANKYKNR
ncbi:hypothetical protein AVEN_197937-1 [Araneus ventricosus]|uniref:RNase H type-1 domain-containing protein n=1 Tax=Araneus ventricosus TaxID=182803 RepID=A0A4Y2CJG2_ARAVE|nr:hypothetical protein AVEN_197937-1 [Araneus ventricosus]